MKRVHFVTLYGPFIPTKLATTIIDVFQMPPIVSILPADVVQLVASALENGMHDVPNAKASRLSILRLLHPRTGLPSLFLPTGTTSNSIIEIQAISPPDERSWFIDQEVIEDGKLLVMTPIDPAFLLLPIITASQSSETSTQFRTTDDIFEAAAAQITCQASEDTAMPTKQDILEFITLDCVKNSIAQICETKEVTPEITVYRFSSEKLQEYLKARVSRIAESQAFKASKTVTRNLARDGLMDDGKEELLNLGRIRASCDLLAQYLSPEHKILLFKSYDFTLLDQHISWLNEIAVKNAATTAPPGGKKGKAAATTDKKRKATKASHGVETLKKVNVSELATFLEPSPVITSIGVKVVPGQTETAYTQLAFSDNNGPSSRNNTKDQKYHAIAGQRPSMLHTRSNRVSSLPNQQLSESDPILPARRIVSMPDVYLDNDTHRTRYMHDIPDDMYFSIEPVSRVNTGDGHRHYMSDFPRTPSPSSPDSIMIIGNDFHVPDLLHRPESKNPDWTSWASSPPKPIPALHGPLSLPYARCPSGAEGTVIDGDDLPHKIWGLGLDEAQSQIKSTRGTPALQVQNWVPSALPQTSKLDKTFTTRYGSESVINLVEPRNILMTKELRRSVLKGSSTLDNFASDTNAKPRAHALQYSRMNSIDLATLVPRQDFLRPKSLPSSAPRYLYPSLDKRNMAHPSLGESALRPSTRLNTAAQVFIPSNNINSSALGAISREAMKNFPSATAFLGAQHSMPRTETELPTPPATVSPEWSPVFPYPALPSLTSISGLNKLLDNPLEGSLQNLSIQDSCGYSPYLDGFDDHAANLMNYMRQLRDQEMVLNRQEPHLNPRRSSYSSGLSNLGGRDYGSNHIPVNAELKGSIVERQVQQQRTNTNPATEQFTSSDRRKNLTSQHPRSIPLARLIQRRLSSVVEEDNSADKLLPVHKQRPAYQPRLRGNYQESSGELGPNTGSTPNKPDTSHVVESDGSSIASTSSGTSYHQHSARSARDSQAHQVQNENARQKLQGDARQPNKGETQKRKYKSKKRNEGVA